MSKFNTTTSKTATGTGPVQAVGPGTTHEGGQGYVRDVKGELFMLAVANFVGEDTYYEKATERDARFERLVRQMALADPGWTARLLIWLRSEGNLRSAPMVGAAEFVKARLDEGASPEVAGTLLGTTDQRGIDRALVDAVLQRGDEPGEALAYWASRYGRAVPKPVKRGVADAALRLYNEYALLKYDTASKGFRFGDVIDLTHPPAIGWQGELFRHALDRRHNRDNPVPDALGMVRANVGWRMALANGEQPDALLHPETLKNAGLTWEDVLSALGDKVAKAHLWTALVPTMGYMALLRNLRNLDEAGVTDAVASQVIARLTDPERVARSRQLPFRFLAAYENAPSLRWGHALDTALNLSLSNVPALTGRTLVLVDTSASMTSGGFSKHSTMTPAKAAAVFGVTLAVRCGADLHGFADGVFSHPLKPGASVLREVKRFVDRTGEVGHGTYTAQALRATFKNHDRVFLVSDMQTMDHHTSTAVPATTTLYGVNLGGYRVTAVDAGKPNRVELGGLTDATFKLVPLLEAGAKGEWPF